MQLMVKVLHGNSFGCQGIGLIAFHTVCIVLIDNIICLIHVAFLDSGIKPKYQNKNISAMVISIKSRYRS